MSHELFFDSKKMNNPTSSLVLLFFLLIFTCFCQITAKADDAQAKLYIVCLGHKPHDDHELITDSHHDILGQVAGSKEEAKKLMLYSYRHGFSGFAAKLTASQAKQIGGIRGDSEAFNDEGLGPIPSRWKGKCISEGNFDATKHCNRKIIGARWYIKGLMEERKLNETMARQLYNLSSLDNTGHGTHVAYTAAGSYVNNLEYYGLNMGTTRGGAPLARLAIYKVSWKNAKGVPFSSGADILSAIDDAIRDGVDILSASLAGGPLTLAEVHADSILGIGSFHAVSHGIPVVAAGGNSGPNSNTIANTSPWLITVAASNEDTQIVTPLTLGNNKTILVSPKDVMSIANEVKGKVVMLFSETKPDIVGYLIALNNTGVSAFIYAMPPLAGIEDFNQIVGIPIPFIAIDFEQGNQIVDYFINCKSNNQDPIIKLGRSEVLEGKKTILKVPKFSSRGPNSFTPEILKPDVAAPGVNVLAAFIPRSGDNGFKLQSGTSMATPHVSGIIALLKVAHPNWSPAAIKSALVTTDVITNILTVRVAWNEDTYTSEIFSEGAGDKLADPFDFGGGICNPNGATDPGLVYDMDKDDYLNYLCSLGYSNEMVYNATTYLSSSKNSTAAGGIVCPIKVPSRLDLNLPSISIPNLKNSVTVKRTVTNVGNVNSIYKVLVKPPRNTAIKRNKFIYGAQLDTEEAGNTVDANRDEDSGFEEVDEYEECNSTDEEELVKAFGPGSSWNRVDADDAIIKHRNDLIMKENLPKEKKNLERMPSLAP
ncbi:subtilisin-like protease sbt3.9 [Nicotiana attenuata]|uniref:Subtilisin-like protease sbt3.9 n=1 Tax=Nicotiana attenuata TaxID=49451 RepID=A0A1J6II59_NICAT|nr:subtilisin-like protease sbt3.9 [Nicotiana attenuata]